MRVPRTRIALILLCVMIGTISWGQSDMVKTGTLPRGMESFDTVFPRLMGEWEIPGGAVAVAKDGRLVLARGYGLADKDKRTPVDPFKSVFRLASLSKAITAVAILKLAELGKLKLDDPVFSILPHLAAAKGPKIDSRLGQITIRHLLHHSGGWDVAASFDPMFSGRMIAEQQKTACPPTIDAVIRFMVTQPLSYSPGTKYVYSNFGYCLLGRVIEKVSGQSYEAFVQQKILKPAGINGFALGKTLKALPSEVTYYTAYGVGQGPSVFDTHPGDVEWPYGGWSLENMDSHGGWTAPAIDMIRLVLALDGRLGGRGLLSPTSMKMMLARPPAPLFSGEAYWYGMGLLVRPTQNGVNWWHMGSLDGTTTIMVRTFHGLAWVGLFNSRPRNHEGFNGALDNACWEAVQGVTNWPSHDLFKKF